LELTKNRASKGDPEIRRSPITKRNITVDAGCKSRFTANRVLKDAGIGEKL
jgi:hypothetical protein